MEWHIFILQYFESFLRLDAFSEICPSQYMISLYICGRRISSVE